MTKVKKNQEETEIIQKINSFRQNDKLLLQVSAFLPHIFFSKQIYLHKPIIYVILRQ